VIQRIESGEGEEEKRKEGRLGHAAVRRRRSFPKTSWDSFPLSVFPISMVFPHCSWWCCLAGFITFLIQIQKSS